MRITMTNNSNTKASQDEVTHPKPSAVSSNSDNDALDAQRQAIDEKAKQMPKEVGGRSKDKGLEPTRYGDWELKGRCIDF